MNIVLTDSGSNPFTTPATMMVHNIMHEMDWELHRAPFSTQTILAGDGKRVPAPFDISGNAYFDDAYGAEQWLDDLFHFDPVQIDIGTDSYNVLAMDFTAVPVLLDRVLKVHIRVFPE